MINREVVSELLNIYKRAWENQDPELILTIFQPNAVYHERIFDQPYRGHAQIKKYWIEKVLKRQKNITFNLLSLYIDNQTAVAEWEAKFDDLDENTRKHMIEVAILEINDNKIQSLREYWASRDIS